VREFFFIIKRLVFAELFKDVVHISDRELRVLGLLTFAVRVKLFAKLAKMYYTKLASRSPLHALVSCRFDKLIA
jgi:hypothetical protein